MTIEDLARQLGHAAQAIVPQASFRARVKLRVLEAIEPQTHPKPSWIPVFLRSVAGTLAVLVVAAGGVLWIKAPLRTEASYIGEVELVAGGGLEIVHQEEGKEPVTESVGQHTQVKTIKIRAGDIIKTSSGSTIALRFDNHSSAVIKDEAVLTVGGVTAKNAKDEPTAVAVVLEKGTIETAKQDTGNVRGAVLEVQTSSKTVETSNVAVAVSVQDDGKTSIEVDETNPLIRTLDLGSRVIVGAALSTENQNGNGSVPSPSASVSPASSTPPVASPSPTPTNDTGSGRVLGKDAIDIVIPIRLK